MEHTPHHHASHEEALAQKPILKIAPIDPLTQATRTIVLGLLASALIVGCAIYLSTLLLVNSVAKFGLSATAATNQQGATAAVTPRMVTLSARDNEPVFGKKDAPVTMYEFEDFQCPFCKQYFQIAWPEIKSKYVDTGKVKVVFRHFPLSIHGNANIAAIAAECANNQGKFWEYHDKLFTEGQSDGTGLDVASLQKYGDAMGLNKGTLGLGKNKFSNCLTNKETSKVVTADQSLGQSLGVTGTPSFLIVKSGAKEVDGAYIQSQTAQRKDKVDLPDGVFVVGSQQFSSFSSAIDSLLK